MVPYPPLATRFPFRWLLNLKHSPVRVVFGGARRHRFREGLTGTPALQQAMLYARLAALPTESPTADLHATEEDATDDGGAHAH